MIVKAYSWLEKCKFTLTELYESKNCVKSGTLYINDYYHLIIFLLNDKLGISK